MFDCIHSEGRQLFDFLFFFQTVLDFRCGTGILSLFAAKAGAKRVYAIDISNITECTRQIVAENKMDDVITVIQGGVEDIDLPAASVDVIVSMFFG